MFAGTTKDEVKKATSKYVLVSRVKSLKKVLESIISDMSEDELILRLLTASDTTIEMGHSGAVFKVFINGCGLSLSREVVSGFISVSYTTQVLAGNLHNTCVELVKSGMTSTELEDTYRKEIKRIIDEAPGE